MSRLDLPKVVVGNDFLLPQTSFEVAAPAATPKPVIVPPAPVLHDFEPGFEKEPHGSYWLRRLQGLAHRYALGTFALLFLVVGASAVLVAGSYRSARIAIASTGHDSSIHVPVAPAKGPNLVVASNQLGQALQKITGQPLNLGIGSKTVPVSSDTIKSWLQIVESPKQGVTYIHVNEAAVNKSLADTATPYVKAPVNQVVLNHPDGTSQVIAAGRNGTSLGDVTPLSQQIVQTVLAGKGLELTLPIQTQAFGTSTAADIGKLIEVNVVTKQMYLYEKGQLVRSYPISAGAPETPTPIGQFQIYQKLALQDMKGFNADGTKYFQPNVRWINYFLPGGYAVHGNYWRPQSWFGARNSSHGCVSLPDAQAKEVYDWAPLGTTVIVHY